LLRPDVMPTPPEALLRFRDLFDRGQYWESHEVLEAEWRRTGSRFYHALILYASAWVHFSRRNRHGVLAQLRKAGPLLESYRPGYLGVDVEAILVDCEILRVNLEEGRFSEVTPRIRSREELFSGKEPELGGPD
jgi:predicted metal-dependent hydrolase